MNIMLHAFTKTSRRLFASVLLLALGPAAFALTINFAVTPEYVKEHPQEFSVKVSQTEKGLLEFTITQNASASWYIVSSLALRKNGDLVAETFFPPFVKQHDITFSFRVAPEFAAESVFELGDCAYGKAGDEIVPVPGTKNYIFKLKDFVAKDLLQTPPAKESIPVTPSPNP